MAMIRRRGVSGAFLSAALAGLVGCQTAKPLHLEGTVFDPATPSKYVLYPGDQLEILHPNDSSLDQEVLVRSDGMISLPYVGDVQAGLRSPDELASMLNERYGSVLQKPDVTVVVKEESGRRIFLGGEVQKPGAMSLFPNQTLLQSIIAAGGTTMAAYRQEVLVMRACPGAGVHVVKADLDRILAAEDPDIRLMPLDIVHVPQSTIAKVNDFVEQYINRVVPRPFNATFYYELHTQPVEVKGDGQAFPVEISRR